MYGCGVDRNSTFRPLLFSVFCGGINRQRTEAAAKACSSGGGVYPRLSRKGGGTGSVCMIKREHTPLPRPPVDDSGGQGRLRADGRTRQREEPVRKGNDLRPWTLTKWGRAEQFENSNLSCPRRNHPHLPPPPTTTTTSPPPFSVLLPCLHRYQVVGVGVRESMGHPTAGCVILHSLGTSAAAVSEVVL